MIDDIVVGQSQMDLLASVAALVSKDISQGSGVEFQGNRARHQSVRHRAHHVERLQLHDYR